MALFDHSQLWTYLSHSGCESWAECLQRQTADALQPDRHGRLNYWIQAWNRLPECAEATIDGSTDAVTVTGLISAEQQQGLRDTLMQLHPWRKGPFRFFDILLDTEWRSNLKWDRLSAHVDFRDRNVLDIGSGNGYYGWRMLSAGAKMVVGFDPMPLYLMQYECVRKYASSKPLHFILPLTDQMIPERLWWFDVTVSMGVLYHRTSPIDHLKSLSDSLRPGGRLVLETLVLDSPEDTVLVPEDRYAKMRNVWFIPSIPMLNRWLRRTGFRDIELIDLSVTTSSEQRRTEWMTFESLSDFLKPDDPTQTTEGLPGPHRAMLTAVRS
ncbi:MAG: tRNA 5-methoxyuridine(34)/uridine 5-oxyacetic acid(34) synthase CmoB [Planctomycetota bacterium]